MNQIRIQVVLGYILTMGLLWGCQPTNPEHQIGHPTHLQQTTQSTTRPQKQTEILAPAHDTQPVNDDVHDQLAALGYMGGYEEATHEEGVITIDEARVTPGLNLVVSGHAPEVVIMTSKGEILHRWTCPRNQAFPDIHRTESDKKARSFRRAYLLPQGDLIGIYNGTGMIRLNKNSEISWSQSEMCHHDLGFSADGSKIYTFIQTKRQFPAINSEEPVMDEFIATIDCTTGKIIDRVSILDAFQHSNYAALLRKTPKTGDVLHANTITEVTSDNARKISFLQAGDLLLSLRNIDTIAVYRPGCRSIVWALNGMWVAQHEPSILSNGNIILFDNIGEKGHSKVMEFNPLTQEIAWTYDGTHERPLYSTTSGTCYRLNTDNTLIVESNSGRAIEVTKNGEIVWEFINPGRWGKNKTLRGTLFDVQRLSAIDF